MKASARWCPCLRSEDIRNIFDHLWASLVATAELVLHDPAEAEEVAQEAMVRIVARYCQLRGADSVRAWARTITRRLALNRQREALRRRTRENSAEEPKQPPADPEEIVSERERIRGLASALDALPDDVARLLRLRIVEARSVREIAHQEGVPIGTVMSRLARARERLRISVVPSARGPARTSSSSRTPPAP